MQIAYTAAAINGSFIQWRFDTEQARQNQTASIETKGSEYAPAPENIQTMQRTGADWARQLSLARSTVPRLPLRVQFSDSPHPIQASRTSAAPSPARPQEPPPRPASPLDALVYAHLRTLHRSCHQLARRIIEAGSDNEHRQRYMHALNAIDRLIKSIRKFKECALMGPNTSAGDTGGGLIAVDLDEAIHGLYTAIAYTKSASANGVSGVGESLAKEADLWAHDPMRWLKQTATPHGAADVGVAAVVTIALVPFALMALHAGIGEIRESKRHGKALEAELIHTGAFLETLKQLSSSLRAPPTLHLASDLAANSAANSASNLASSPTTQPNSPPAPDLPPRLQYTVDAAIAACSQQLDDLKHAQQKNRENGHIGACSAMSGGAIAVKATLDLTGKVGYLALAGSAAGTLLATSVGVAGSVLAPIAAVSAVGLGTKMVMKSNQALKNFTAVCALLKRRLNTSTPLLSPAYPDEEVSEYLQFLPKKLDQRTRFLNNYAEKNRRFLFGSVLYATSTLVGLGLTGAALLGAGLVLGPVGLGALVAVGITGGLLMGRYSTQFLFGHGRLHRYENYAIGDDPEIERHFLSSIEAFTKGDFRLPRTTGIEMRAAFYDQITKREELRQDFLATVAGDLGKRHRDMVSYSTDREAIRHKRDGVPTKWEIVRAGVRKKYESTAGYLRAGAFYIATLIETRDHGKAKMCASQLRRETKSYLNVDNLHDWLEQRENYSAQLKLMHGSLNAQIAYLRHKNKIRLKIYALSNDIYPQQAMGAANVIETGGNIHIENQEIAPPLDIFLDQLTAPLIRDFHLLDQAENLQKQVRKLQIEKKDLRDEAAVAAITSRFLSLQKGRSYDSSADTPDIRQSQAALAKYYMNEAAGRHRNLRGLLIESELEATRLAHRPAAKVA
ncbi:MAG TPA: hypothetical protein VGM52_10955 [Herbaspirillum sp.]|jgi:hypothetical protein